MPSYDVRVLGENNHLFSVVSDKKCSLNVALISDAHIDNEKCDLGLLKEHLQEAKHRDALVMLNGDTLDVMSGKGDRRACKKSLRAELIRDEHYLDNVVDFGVDWFAKHCGERLAWVGLGNHETAISKVAEVSLVRMFIDRYNARVAPEVHTVMGSYKSYINLQFKRKQSGSRAFSILAHHGWGGGSPVTKATGQFSRIMADIGGGIDAIWMGHVHQQYAVRDTVFELDQYFSERKRSVWHIRTSTYKEELSSENSHGRGWAHEKGMSGKPLGGAFLRLDWTPNKGTIKSTVELMSE